jgi:hypothetical protein
VALFLDRMPAHFGGAIVLAVGEELEFAAQRCGGVEGEGARFPTPVWGLRLTYSTPRSNSAAARPRASAIARDTELHQAAELALEQARVFSKAAVLIKSVPRTVALRPGSGEGPESTPLRRPAQDKAT